MKRMAILLSLAFAPALAAQADITPNQERKAQQVNIDLKQDIQDQAEDTKKVRKLRKRIRDAYGDYRETVRKHGNGTDPSRKAARKVLASQQALRTQIEKEEGRLMSTPPAPDLTRTEAEQVKKEVPTAEPPARGADGSVDQLYQDILRQFGDDSPQAEAARRHFQSRQEPGRLQMDDR